MNTFAIAFWLLVMVDVILFISGAMIYRIDRSGADSISNALGITFILTICAGLGWFFDTFLMWKP